MITLFLKEIRHIYNTPISYIFVLLFSVMSSLIIWIIPFYSVCDSGYASVQFFFDFAPYLFGILIPSLTMHTFIEEKSSGTLSYMQIISSNYLSIILSKFFSMTTVIVIAIFFTLPNYFLISKLSIPSMSGSFSAVVLAYIGLFLLANCFLSIGLMFSLLFSKQIISLIVSSFTCIFLYSGLDLLRVYHKWSGIFYFLSLFSLKGSYDNFNNGVFESRSFLYLCFFSYVMNFFSYKFISLKKDIL